MSALSTPFALPRPRLLAALRSSFAHWGALLWHALLLQGERRAAQALHGHHRAARGRG